MNTDKENLQLLYDTMSEFEANMQSFSDRGHLIARRTVIIINSVIALLLVVAMIIFYLIHDLSGDMTEAISNMEDMYERFGTMSTDMGVITGAVVNMSENVTGIPDISVSMQDMNLSVGNMTRNVHSMTEDIVVMDRNMIAISGSVYEMANRFDHLNYTVHTMRHNVNQMSGPLR
ncbi:MAG: hypothetical protein GY731_06745 [Gammaproteobacteria bacterium]|nr:hypothetical protein [Gammaproteobacteria bacterium]